METTKGLLLDFKGNRDYKMFSAMAVQNESNIDNMLELCLTVKYPFPQYSSWLMSHVAEHHVKILIPFQDKLVDAFLKCTDHSTKRNLANALLKLPETNYKDGERMDCLFKILQNSDAKVALKAYAMYLLVPLVKPYPELQRELKLVLHSRLELESSAFRGAVKKVEKMLGK